MPANVRYAAPATLLLLAVMIALAVVVVTASPARAT